MIPVFLQNAPQSFAANVNTPGLSWLALNKIPLAGKPPKGTKLPPLWRKSLGDLHAAYGGICAYLCIYIEIVGGGASADHYIAKSKAPWQAYDWDNYRLAYSNMNSRKRDYSNVLDPIGLAPDTFALRLASGQIDPGSGLAPAARAAARATIRRLKLDSAAARELRARRFSDYLALRGPHPNAIAEDHLRRYSPFVWYEAGRQGLL